MLAGYNTPFIAHSQGIGPCNRYNVNACILFGMLSRFNRYVIGVQPVDCCLAVHVVLGTIRLSICGYPARAVRLQHTFQHIGYIQLQLHRLQRYAALAALCCYGILFPTELCPFNSLHILPAVDCAIGTVLISL